MASVCLCLRQSLTRTTSVNFDSS